MKKNPEKPENRKETQGLNKCKIIYVEINKNKYPFIERCY